MRLALLSLIAASLLALPVSADAQRRVDGRRGGAGFFYVGVASSSFGELNRALVAAGLPEMDETAPTVGGGGYAVIGRLLIGGQGHGMSWGSESVGGTELTLDGGYGLFDLGYVIPVGERGIFYPMIGIGGSGMRLLVTNRDGVGLGPNINDPNFSEVLDEPGHRSSLTRGSMLLNVGAGFDIPVLRPRSGLMLGLRVGYLFSPGADRWYLYDTRVLGGPDVSPEGLHVRLGIGGGRLR